MQKAQNLKAKFGLNILTTPPLPFAPMDDDRPCFPHNYRGGGAIFRSSSQLCPDPSDSVINSVGIC